MLAIIIVCEFQSFCLPDVSPFTYNISYVSSFIVVIIIRVSQAFCNQENNFEINSLYMLSITFIVAIIFGLDAYLVNDQTSDADDSLISERVGRNPMRDYIKEGTSSGVIM